jgi:hypothetical protein
MNLRNGQLGNAARYEFDSILVRLIEGRIPSGALSGVGSCDPEFEK